MSERTLTDLLALPAGRELDEQIYAIQHADMVRAGVYPMLPAYSHRIEDAFPLLAEMLAARVRITLRVLKSGNLILEAEWGDKGFAMLNLPTLADAPLAICRAWATWKMGGKA